MLIGLGAKSQVLHDLGVVMLFANKKVLFGEVESIQGLGKDCSAENCAPASGVGWGLESALSVFEHIVYIAFKTADGIFGGTGGFLFSVVKGVGFQAGDIVINLDS